KEGTSAVHGAPLGEDGIKMAKEVYGWDYPDFTVPEEVAARFHQTMIEEGQKAEDAWNEMFANYKKAYPELAQQFEDAFDGKLPENWDAELPTYEVGSSQASRVSSKEVIQELSKAIPSFWGGSADLSGSNNTMVAADKDFTPEH
ncbi:transketolase, partial [Enterococcus faecium]